MSEEEKTKISNSESKEECLEALCRLENAHEKMSVVNLAKNSDLKGIPLTEILLDLALTKDVILEDDNIFLTKKGRSIGENIVKKHELVEKILLLFGLKKIVAHKKACKLEHSLSNSEITELNLRLPTLSKILEQDVTTLDKAEIGKTYKIVLIRAGSIASRRLEDLGLGQNSVVNICNIQDGGPIEIKAHGACTALGHGIASKIIVVPENKNV